MSARLIQAPDSKVWHIALQVGTAYADHPLPICQAYAEHRFRPARSKGLTRLAWRTPRGVCCNCSRLVEQAVRLIAAEESRS